MFYSCVDTRDYKHAELSKWHTKDERCTWTMFNPSEACQVVKNSLFNDIYFVGDSFIRNMFLSFLITVSGDMERGSWGKDMSQIQKELCVGETLLFYDECRTIIKNMNDVLHPETFCGGAPRDFNASFFFYPDFNKASMFAQLMKSLSGKRRSLVLLSVGYWDGSNAQKTILKYINPGLKVVTDQYKQNSLNNEAIHWPQLFYFLPMTQGLLKSPDHFFLQDNPKIHKISEQMLIFGEQNNITVFDFRQLVKHIHSFDGTHYNVAVNIMKNQIFLHYLQSLK